ncbi:hypothetical protein TCAL_11301 [Tigriopus californicus]|uniref:Uncharacterized protein n=1 Tax=Tigriopus californicus TaxID=6832 RepID=A0A553N9P2_TIGCA|nr:mucin-2-like [Tigriopus californicus]TRY62143.1 hypothetical protein TCAL_11301 [Tigriopus californicus]
MRIPLNLVALAIILGLVGAQQTLEEELVIKDPELIQELLKAATVETSERDIPLPPVEVLATTPPAPLSTTEPEPVPLRQRFRLRNRNRPTFLPRTRPSVLTSANQGTETEAENGQDDDASSSLFAPKRLRTRFQPRARPNIFASRSRVATQSESKSELESESLPMSTTAESQKSDEASGEDIAQNTITIEVPENDDEDPQSNEISDDNEGEVKATDETMTTTSRSLFAPRRRFRPRPRLSSVATSTTVASVEPTDVLPTEEIESTDESPTSSPRVPASRPLLNNRRTSPFLRRIRPTSSVLGVRGRGSRVTTVTTTTITTPTSTTSSGTSVFITTTPEYTTYEPEVDTTTEIEPEVTTKEASIFVTVASETESPESVTSPPTPAQPVQPAIFGRRRIPEKPRRRLQPQQVASEPTSPRRRVVSRRRNPNAVRRRLQPETPVPATAEPQIPETTTNQRVLPPTARQIIRIQPAATEPQPTADTTTTTASQTVPSTARQVIQIQPDVLEPQPTEDLPPTTATQPETSAPPRRRFQTAPRRTFRTNPRRLLSGTGPRRIPVPEPEQTAEGENTVLTGTAPRRRIDFTSGRTQFTGGRVDISSQEEDLTDPEDGFVDIPKIKQVNEFIPRQIKVTPQVEEVPEEEENQQQQQQQQEAEVEAPRSTQPSRALPFVPLFTLQAEPTESLRLVPSSDPTKPTNSASSPPTPSRQSSRFQPLTFTNSIVFSDNKLPDEITIPNVRPGIQQRLNDPAQIARDILKESIVVPLVKIDPPTTLASQPPQPTQPTEFVPTTFSDEPQTVTRVVPTNSFLENTVRSNALPNKFQVTKPAQSSGERVTVEDRYRHQNPDGSITWGYKSTDGSFKEETIGADCVTRGRYGYIDPQGKIREFSYQNGIPCNPQTREVFNRRSSKSTASKPKKVGYYDYNTNKFVLPDGRRVTLEVNDKFRARG